MTQSTSAGSRGVAGEDRFPVGSRERPDPGGCVLRGRAAEGIARLSGYGGRPPGCRAGVGSNGGLHKPGCESEAVMEVYGIEMCEAHGEEAAAGALEEIRDDLESELQRPANPYARRLSPHLGAALRRGLGVLDAPDDPGQEAALLAAFPLRADEACGASIAHAEEPSGGHEPPYDDWRDDRLLIHRHMRLAFEARADWLVETLERERIQIAAQCAYALALDADAGLRPAPGREGGPE